MNFCKDKGLWIGFKGVKVVFVVLMGGFMDGFMGQKSYGGGGGGGGGGVFFLLQLNMKLDFMCEGMMVVFG